MGVLFQIEQFQMELFNTEQSEIKQFQKELSDNYKVFLYSIKKEDINGSQGSFRLGT